MKKPTILIFEPQAAGHEMYYVRFILTLLCRRIGDARIILLTTAEAANHVNCQRVIKEFADFLTVRIAPPVDRRNRLLATFSAFYEQQWRRTEQLRMGLREIGIGNIDFLLIPHLESVGLLQLALRRKLFAGTRWATIAIGIRFHHRKCGIEGPFRLIDLVQTQLFRWVIRDPSLAFFATPNPYFQQFTADPKVRYCPEPCALPALRSAAETRAVYGIRPDTFVVLAFGFLDHRKCLGVLLEAAARLRDELDVTVFLAGTQHTSLAPILRGAAAAKLRARDSLVEVNRFIVGGKDVDPFGAADLSWVFYAPDFVLTGSVLVWSGLARRPVIARRRGVIGRLVEEHRLGLALGSEDPEIVAGAIRRLADNPALRREMGENGARLFARNTPENFAAPIVDGIGTALAESTGARPAAATVPGTASPAGDGDSRCDVGRGR